MTWGGGVMRRRTASKRGWLLPLLAACAFGYLTGAWHVAALREASAAEVVAQRFPEEWKDPVAVTLAAAVRNSRADPDLFSPAPMIPLPYSRSNAEPPAEKSAALAPEPPMVQTASLDSGAPPAAKPAYSPPRPAAGAAVRPSTAAAHPSAASRTSYI